MRDFEKDIKLAIAINQPESIRTALQQYQHHLRAGTAFVGQWFDIEFVATEADGSQRPLQFSDITDGNMQNIAELALSKGSDDISYLKDKLIKPDDEIYISEILFFALALQYPQLKDDIVATAELIVAYARYCNNTDVMWVDSMRLFGTEALFMLACVDVQYVTLLAKFYIHYWDEEHTHGYEEFLSYFVQQHGWSRQLINAFVHCDNSYYRIHMFVHPWQNGCLNQPIGEYLREHPAEYRWFKHALRQRLLTTPVTIAENVDLETEVKVVREIFTTLFSAQEGIDSEQAFWQQPMVDGTLGDEADALEAEILAQAQRPIAWHHAEAPAQL
ncbi:DUF6138 family protein [Shewanella sp. C32]|uniref:DUF6138 family protein n=1 Tax=Shewanella electrica TaxID=515560 RepID=A0ABT2FF32_9GAMM|nr:DUF6138 family protein [Shewanella electrica]MCH1925055.1 DUF6138 family protein [Shewanella electrica]MCS4554879.1 DUF6138 family protein [Shewanella electrica]